MNPDGDPQIRWSAAIVNHGDYAELARCLISIGGQSLLPDRVCVYDTGEDARAFESLQSQFDRVDFELGGNRGYSGAANRLVDRLVGLEEVGDTARPENGRALTAPDSSPHFVLILNSDVELDPEFAKELTAGMAGDDRIAIAGGKLLRPDRERIDTTGIVFPRNGRPVDRGSECRDHGQFDRAEKVAGVSGAALMLRVSVLEPLRIDGEIFDESFFAYHEDTDLCWRARNLGFEIGYFPTATAIHRRGWRKDGRFDVPIEIRRHSFKNHYLQLVKNETLGGALMNAPWLIAWESMRLGFVLLRDRELIPAYGDAFKLLPDAWRKRKRIAAKRAEMKSPGIPRNHQAQGRL